MFVDIVGVMLLFLLFVFCYFYIVYYGFVGSCVFYINIIEK